MQKLAEELKNKINTAYSELRIDGYKTISELKTEFDSIILQFEKMRASSDFSIEVIDDCLFFTLKNDSNENFVRLEESGKSIDPKIEGNYFEMRQAFENLSLWFSQSAEKLSSNNCENYIIRYVLTWKVKKGSIMH